MAASAKPNVKKSLIVYVRVVPLSAAMHEQVVT
jgi:hypothetical protein